MDLWEEAQISRETERDEHGWNVMVHGPLLKESVRKGRPFQDNRLVQLQPCTTARIIKEYLPQRADGKVVDFCMTILPDRDGLAAEAIRRLRQDLPEMSINHTAFEPLSKGPICVSIETKRAGSGSLKAELQVGTWQCAQWRMLARLVADRVVAERESCEKAGSQEDAVTNPDPEEVQKRDIAEVERRLAALPFLPCVIIQGERWSIAATTSKPSGKTILWSDFCFGDTESMLGIWQIISGLRWLVRWSEQVYWPWFLKQVCGLEP